MMLYLSSYLIVSRCLYLIIDARGADICDPLISPPHLTYDIVMLTTR